MRSKIFEEAKEEKKPKRKKKLSVLSKLNKAISHMGNPFRSKPDESEQVKVPKEWVKKSKHVQQGLLVVDEGEVKRKKYHVPYLLKIKRTIAGLMIPIDFIIAQASLMGPATSQVLWLLFMANTLICADYLWKTRRPPELFEEPKP